MTAPTPRIALVTGGNRGIGRQAVLALAQRGVSVIFTYNTGSAEAEAVVSEANSDDVSVSAVHLDVSRTDKLPEFVESVRAELAARGSNQIDFLLNNAGIWLTASFAETTVDDFDRLYAVNVRGVFFVTQALVPLMRDGGRIVNVSSGLVRFTFPMKIAYASVKGAVEPFTRYLAVELAPHGITVNTLAPGATATDFSGGVIRDDPAYRDRVAAIPALGRPADPEDIGPVVAALFSDDLHWVDGERIEASGGMRL